MSGLKLVSTGAAIPAEVVTNEDLTRRVDTSDEWIVSRTGIRSRRWCGEGESHTSLCLAAARQAMERAGIGPEEIGVCLVATFTGDRMTPGAATILQGKLGLREDTVCFDLNAACAGFIYAVHTASRLLPVNGRRYGLVLGAEVLTRVTDFDDRSTCVLFGDGAGAAVVEWGEDYPDPCTVMGCQARDEVLCVPGIHTGEENVIRMDGQAVFRFAVEALPRCVEEVLAKAGVGPEAVDRFVFHQANQRIIDLAVRKLKLPVEKCAGNIDHTGNTSAASIPLLLDELVSAGQLKQGQRALCVGFGAGLTWAGALLELR